MIKLKSLLFERREHSHCWLSPMGRIVPVKDTHMTTAMEILPNEKDPMTALWAKGWLRITYMYDGSLIAHNEKMAPNEKQFAVLKRIAQEGDHTKIEFDNGTDSKLLWTVNDVLQERNNN